MPRTIADLMKATGLGRDATRQAVRNGELPGYVVGSRYVIPDDAFDRFCRGEWTPQPRQVIVTAPVAVTPITPIKKRSAA